ncbi:adenine-specific methyltransferase EcoRI family protein [Bifidobacterium sp. SO1]|uniref:adenine-specific methyltransferase EcoRI family protein n=1 Tax=Bifidobacterium sp. SO1 TaxID=2809029 RepID=UPI001BDCC010|nr:adenine-specific methyltransferase EcoRI family protein [Bifidobacterium sp. SO1]MBT1161746.1 hypothetical protein [Bifidobacterium sp. SO1]
MAHRDNRWLKKANRARADEFYTLPETVERTLPDYRGSFHGRHVACVSNDGPSSAFMRFLSDRYEEYGLASLIGLEYHEPDLFHPDERGIRWDWNPIARCFDRTVLSGSGSFDTPEAFRLLEETDLVVGNPPFSLFRNYLTTVLRAGCDLLCLGHLNMLAYSQVFPLVVEDRLRIGTRIHSGAEWFNVPDDYGLETDGCMVVDGVKRIRVPGIRWITTLHPDRPELVKFPKGVPYDPDGYRRYDGVDAIDVPSLSLLPNDYDGLIGVPMTILDHDLPSHGWRLVGKLKDGASRYDYGHAVVDGSIQFTRILIQRN